MTTTTTDRVVATNVVATISREQAADLIRELAYYMAKQEELNICIDTTAHFGGAKAFIRVAGSVVSTGANLKGQMINGEVVFNNFEN